MLSYVNDGGEPHAVAAAPYFPLVGSMLPPVTTWPGSVFLSRGLEAKVTETNSLRNPKWSLFRINGEVAMSRGLTYSRSVRPESRSSLASGVAPCLGRYLSIVPRFLTTSLRNVDASFAGEWSRTISVRGLGWFSCSTIHRTYQTSQPGLWWNCTPIPSNAGVAVGHAATSPWPIKRAADASPLFPPRDRAIVKAIACEAVCQTKLPLSRLSTSDLAHRTSIALGRSISPSTVWRILDTDAIKPWRYQYWIFPRDPKFSEKAGRVLDLYAGCWEGKPLGGRDYIISSDEKTSIQARIRCHATLPTGPGRPMRVEHEYERGGALQYLAAWDVRRGRVLGRCEDKTGIDSFGRLVDQVMRSEPYRSAGRVFWVVDNGSSHRGQAAIRRLRKAYRRAVLVHTPVHASWLNQVEIYFSIIQRKVLTPNDFANLEEVEQRLRLYEELSNREPRPFEWKFDRTALLEFLAKLEAKQKLVS
jgi:DDE superfamily endonuclease